MAGVEDLCEPQKPGAGVTMGVWLGWWLLGRNRSYLDGGWGGIDNPNLPILILLLQPELHPQASCTKAYTVRSDPPDSPLHESDKTGHPGPPPPHIL